MIAEDLDMTAAEFKTIRERLGLNTDGLAVVLGTYDGRTVRRWEATERRIPGPVQRLMRLLIASADARALFGIKVLKRDVPAA
jgi:DNA-binding transcriptional regulator YiaG